MGGSTIMRLKKEFEYETPRLDFQDGLHHSFKIIQHCIENNFILSGHDKSDGGLARTLKLPPFVVKEYKMAANRYSLGKVIQCIAVLRDADLKSKGVEAGSMSQEDLLKEMVFKLMH